MRKTKLFYSLALAPLFLGGYDNNIGFNQSALTVTTLPVCNMGEFLVYKSGSVVCQPVTGSGVTVPDCKTPSQLLTYTKAGEITKYSCVDKGSITLSTTDQTTITNLQNQLTILGTKITQVGMGNRVAARTYIGTTKATTNGAMTSGTAKGVAAGSALCAAEFGAGATMCDVYSVYMSIAANKISVDPANGGVALSGGWVYQQEWTKPPSAGGTDPELGMADNCGGYTDNGSVATRYWNGTTFKLQKAVTNGTELIPKFYSNEPCGTVQPVVCCL